MSATLLQAFRDFITPSRIEKLKLLLGDEPDQLENTLQQSFPAIMDGVKRKAQEPGGVDTILEAAKDAYDHNILNDVDTIFSGGGEWIHKGGKFFDNLFPSDQHQVIQRISDSSGAKKSSTHNILIIASLLLLGLIGKHFAGKSADKAALLALLGISPAVAKAAPVQESKKKNGFLWPLLLLLLLAALLWWFLKGKNTGDNRETAAVTDTVEVKKPVIDTVNRTIQLPDNTLFKVSKGTMEYKLVNFIQNPDSVAGKTVWFDFDDVTFDFDKATLTPESAVQLDNIASILKAFPTVKVKIGGYTDKRGAASHEDHNLKLSQERADTILAGLKSRGVPEAQLLGAEGYGSQFATQPASASDEERRVDRRMSLSVREK